MASCIFLSLPHPLSLHSKSCPHSSKPCLPSIAAPLRKCSARHVAVWASEKGDEGIINEDIIARLKTAEEEAARLRQELSEARKGSELMDKISEDISEKTPAQDEARESLFEISAVRKRWLSETDLDFLIGDGPEEGVVQGVTKEGEAIVQRRLILGIGAAAVLGALALIPSDVFQSKPQQPLRNFLVPILRSKDLLDECGSLVDDAQWDQVALVLNRVQKTPNNIRKNLEGAVGYLNSREKREKGLSLVPEIMEHLEQVDYQKYFKDFRRPGLEGGNKNAQYVAFAAQALQATRDSLQNFLSLLPKEAIDDARSTFPSIVN